MPRNTLDVVMKGRGLEIAYGLCYYHGTWLYVYADDCEEVIKGLYPTDYFILVMDTGGFFRCDHDDEDGDSWMYHYLPRPQGNMKLTEVLNELGMNGDYERPSKE